MQGVAAPRGVGNSKLGAADGGRKLPCQVLSTMWVTSVRVYQ